MEVRNQRLPTSLVFVSDKNFDNLESNKIFDSKILLKYQYNDCIIMVQKKFKVEKKRGQISEKYEVFERKLFFRIVEENKKQKR